MQIKILTDSSAEFNTNELIDKKILEVKMPLTIDGEECVQIDMQQFWKSLLDGKTAKTSQPNREELKDIFMQAKQQNYSLICIFMSSKLSGTYDMACSLKNEIDYENIFIIDSLNVTIGQKLIVKEAIKLLNQDLAVQDIVKKLEKFKKRVRLYACLDSLKYLARGGRISKLVANLGNLLKLKPIISITDGLVKVEDKKIGLSLAIKTLISKIVKDKICLNYKPIPIFAYDNSNCKRFKAEFIKNSNITEFEEFTDIGPVIGSHIGPGGFGLVYVTQE